MEAHSSQRSSNVIFDLPARLRYIPTYQEVDLKTLQILLAIMLCTTPLYAEQALILTEIEGIQEKVWYLQRDITAQKGSVEKTQKQLKLLVSRTDKHQLNQNKQLTALVQVTTKQQNETIQIESDLKSLIEALSAQRKEVKQQNLTILDQAGKVGTLEGSRQALRAEFAAQQASANQAHAEIHQQLIEIRSQLDTLSQNTGTRIEQISLWGGGAALVLAIVLTIILASRKSPTKRTSHERKPPPKHEM